MTIKDASELALSLLEGIRWYWNFYVTVILAILGWFVNKGGISGWYARALLSVAFVAFALMNLMGLVTTGEALSAVSYEIRALAEETPLASAELKAFYVDLPDRPAAWPGWLKLNLPWIIHLPIDVGIVVLFWTAKPRETAGAGTSKAD